MSGLAWSKLWMAVSSLGWLIRELGAGDDEVLEFGGKGGERGQHAGVGEHDWLAGLVAGDPEQDCHVGA